MQNLRQYGVSVMTATDVVDDFCLAQGNFRESAILQAYRHLRWSYKELFRETLWEIKKVVLEFDCHSCHKNTIHLPDDCERVLNISVVDCFGKLHPLGFNSDYNTAEIRCLKSKCSCDKCKGDNTLCGAIDTIQVTVETITINGMPYPKTTMIRYDGSGAVQKQTSIPTWDVATSKVVDDVIIETLCNVETTECGCIKVTRPNMDLLRSYCGCGNFIDQYDRMGFSWSNSRAYHQLIPEAYNYWGEWNYNAVDREIIHIFGHGSQKHFGHSDSEENAWRSSIRQVIVSYQTNGETPCQEILVPQYAVNAVQVGMVAMQKQLNPRIGEGEKLASQRLFEAKKMKVFRYLNPVRMDDMSKMQTTLRRW